MNDYKCQVLGISLSRWVSTIIRIVSCFNVTKPLIEVLPRECPAKFTVPSVVPRSSLKWNSQPDSKEIRTKYITEDRETKTLLGLKSRSNQIQNFKLG